MRVLGIDPGTQRTGWGLVERHGSKVVHLGSGVLAAPQGELVERLIFIGAGLDTLLAAHRPTAVAIERIFFAKNNDSALKLGHARGVALLCAGRSGAEVFEYTPAEVKQATCGNGRAAKDQVETMVRMLLGLREALPFDASDALAIALCHAQRSGTAAELLLRDGPGDRPKSRAPRPAGRVRTPRPLGEHE